MENWKVNLCFILKGIESIISGLKCVVYKSSGWSFILKGIESANKEYKDYGKFGFILKGIERINYQYTSSTTVTICFILKGIESQIFWAGTPDSISIGFHPQRNWKKNSNASAIPKYLSFILKGIESNIINSPHVSKLVIVSSSKELKVRCHKIDVDCPVLVSSSKELKDSLCSNTTLFRHRIFHPQRNWKEQFWPYYFQQLWDFNVS